MILIKYVNFLSKHYIRFYIYYKRKGIPNINKDGGDVNDVIPLAIGGNGRTYGVTAVKDQCPRGK